MFGYEVNIFAVLLSALLHMALGFLWYAPSVFGKQWMLSAGLTPEKMAEVQGNGMRLGMLLSLFTSFMIAYVLSVIIGIMGFTGLMYGVVTGVLVWAGFLATSQVGPVLWEGRPMRLYAINAGYYLVSLVVMGAILGLWR